MTLGFIRLKNDLSYFTRSGTSIRTTTKSTLMHVSRSYIMLLQGPWIVHAEKRLESFGVLQGDLIQQLSFTFGRNVQELDPKFIDS